MPNYITTGLKKLKPLFVDKKRFLIAQGGMRSAKTYSIMMLIISWCQTNGNKIASVTGISYPHLAKGAIRDFQTIMKQASIWEPDRWNGGAKTYTFSNDSILEFISVDKMDAHGPARDLLFVNEANDMDWETFDQLASRTADKVIIDYNPTAEFWAHTKLLKEKPDKCDFIILTYQDNQALNPNIREYIEDHRPKKGEKPSNWWLVYGLGQIGSLEDNIYHGWRKATSLELEEPGKLVRYGLDFGYNDPTALVAIYERKDGKTLVRELLYESEMNSDQYPGTFEKLKLDPSVLIVADSARPEIINTIAVHGWLIIGADKNAGSVLRGIDRVQQRQIIYEGKNLEREFYSYAWRKTRTGKVLEVPEDGNDHCLAADTKVLTIHGEKRIADLVGKSGWLFAEHGKIRRFRNVRQTGIEKTLILKFDNGAEIRCSEEHPFYTLNRGIIPAKLLTTKDRIQTLEHGSHRHQRNKATIQRPELLERQEGTILSQCRPQTAQPPQSGLGISQRTNSERDGNRPHRQKLGQQSDPEPQTGHSLREQQKRERRNDHETSRNGTGEPTSDKEMAFIRRGQKLALRTWQGFVERERKDRKKLRPLWERLLYAGPLREGSLLQRKLQDARQTAQTDGASREYTKMLSKESAPEAPVYCLDVYDTSNFAIDGGIIVSNCLDATRYAIDNLEQPHFDF